VTYLRVKELAEARGLNITTLSRKAKLAYSTAHALWHGDVKQLNIKTLDRVALVLGVQVRDLFGGEPSEEALEGDSRPLPLAA
jgi:DNA-binding Xre family transcriptional regulator